MGSTVLAEKIKRLQVQRGETQKGVNELVLQLITDRFPAEASITALDLPCGAGIFLSYVKQLFPKSKLTGADIRKPAGEEWGEYIQMNLSEDFTLSSEEKYDLITSISGVMMFENTKNFISSCVSRLKPAGVFIITNDNSATIIDKLFFLFLGRLRLFKPVFEETETLTQNLSIQELCRLLAINKMEIENITYTSTYRKDLIFFPLAILIYPIQWFYLSRYRPKIPADVIRKVFPFKHYFCRHYIIVAKRRS